MIEFMDKLSSYKLFNYLLPGIIFTGLLNKVTQYSVVQDNLIIGVFIYYFIGLIISRIGSLVIEPFLKKCHFVVFANHEEFIRAGKVDAKLDILSEENNMYRTFCSLFFTLLIMKIYEVLEFNFKAIVNLREWIGLFTFLALFLFAYRKQTKYINSRINANKE